MFINIVIY